MDASLASVPDDPIKTALESDLAIPNPADPQYFEDNIVSVIMRQEDGSLKEELQNQRRHYAFLGIHGEDTGEQVARVRMFVGDKVIDEDFPYPKEITPQDQLETIILARVAELGGNS